MTRIITSIHYDLKFDISTTPPDVHVGFVYRAEDGTETVVPRASFYDDAARRIYASKDPIAAVNGELDAQEEALSPEDVSLPVGKLAELVAAAADAEARARRAAEAANALDAQIAAKRAEVAKLNAP